jgi:hypothetical protein
MPCPTWNTFHLIYSTWLVIRRLNFQIYIMHSDKLKFIFSTLSDQIVYRYYCPALCRLRPTTPLTIIPRYKIFVASSDSPNQKKPTAVTNVVPNALHTAYATDTSSFAKLTLNPTMLRKIDFFQNVSFIGCGPINT